jgi:hypothetical protein
MRQLPLDVSQAALLPKIAVSVREPERPNLYTEPSKNQPLMRQPQPEAITLTSFISCFFSLSSTH